MYIRTIYTDGFQNHHTDGFQNHHTDGFQNHHTDDFENHHTDGFQNHHTDGFQNHHTDDFEIIIPMVLVFRAHKIMFCDSDGFCVPDQYSLVFIGFVKY